MSMKFVKTKGTEGLLKLTKFVVAMLIFRGMRPPNNTLRSKWNTAICYIDDTSPRRNARPVMHWLLANASTLCSKKSDAKIQITVTMAYIGNFGFW